MSNWIGTAVALVFGTLFTLAFIVVGILLIVRSVKDKNKSQESQSWPSILGKVIESRVDTSSTGGEEATVAMYKPYVKYEYAVGGVSYTGDKVKVGMTLSTSRVNPARELVARHPVGSEVRVFYNPANPDDSFLERQGSYTTTLVIGIVLLVIGLCGGVPGFIALLFGLFQVVGSTIK